MEFHEVTSDLQTYRTAIEIAGGDFWKIQAGVTVLSETGIGAHGAYTRSFTNFFNYGNLTAWQDFALAIDGPGMTAVNHGTMSGRGGVLIENRAYFVNMGQIVVWPSPGDTERPGIKVVGEGARIVNDGEIEAEVALLSRGAPVDFGNSGILHGAVHLGDGNDAVTNAGAIEGEVLLGGGNDQYDGRGGTALSVNGQGGRDTLIGGDGADFLVGGRGHDVVRGGGGDDTIVGCYGKDVLKGGDGFDTFVFANLKAPDRIKDFAVGEDLIHLDNAALKGLGSEGGLAEDAFHPGSTATDDDHRIIYDPETGKLWYDRNGDHDGGVTKIANLAKGLDLTHEHFEII
jgi:Ca2+-binding RTX toxin-like protein